MIQPNPKAVLTYNDPKRQRSYLEQVEFTYSNLLGAIERFSSDLSCLLQETPEGETADLMREQLVQLSTIIGRNTAMRHKVEATIRDRLFKATQAEQQNPQP